MKILELEIHNVRGIRELSLKPDGKNFLVWGPNGSGKSAVVDAIDFLLTGQVSRLTGQGTAGITLKKHGPHIDQAPSDASVRAVIELPGVSEPIEIRRCMATPKTLEYEESHTSHLMNLEAIAQRGQHVLTRREILRYITADTSTRAKEIQQLLRISEIEDIRKAVVKADNELKQDLEASKRAHDNAKGAINATAQEERFSAEKVLAFVNKNRAVLGEEPISVLRSGDLKTGIVPQRTMPSAQGPTLSSSARDIANLRKAQAPETVEQLTVCEDQLRQVLTTVKSDPELLRATSLTELTRLGMTLIDKSGRCPLCDTPWPPGKLQEYLGDRLTKAKAATKHQETIAELSTTISEMAASLAASLQKVISVAQAHGETAHLETLRSWATRLTNLTQALCSPLTNYPLQNVEPARIGKMLAPEELDRVLTDLSAALKERLPVTTPEQTAWDSLTRLEENLKAFEKAHANLDVALRSKEMASILLQSFLEARDKILEELYDAISERFVELYRELHKLDEGDFAAKMRAEGAGLSLEVDFYGRGTHPPCALHSEGHQDSMGLCLYLALAEKLIGGCIDLVMLDDVVMSVDVDHRRQLCHLLATSFPDRQFVITTHDKTWANQLRAEGVVTSKGTVEFYNWNISTGPSISQETDMWKKIEVDLQRNDVPNAAARLRRGSEAFLSTVCDALQANVKFRTDGRWELGDFLPSAMGQYRTLLKQAKKSAQSWGANDLFEVLQELDSTAGQIFARSQAEQWAINPNVHYSNWANFSPNDFRPVVEAFQDLLGLFVCSSCGAILHVTTTGLKPANLRCSCGAVDWNLVDKAAR